MTDIPQTTCCAPAPKSRWQLPKGSAPWLASLAIVLGLAILDPMQVTPALGFLGASLLHTAPFLLASVLLAAWLPAAGADALIARAFSGAPLRMIVVAALAGALSPFCSCGVIPLVAALLAMGVPLSAVMAFWLASPIMDPEMFVMTAGILSPGFALAKTAAAIGVGLMGGGVVWALSRRGWFADVLRPEAAPGCGARSVTNPAPVRWRFWSEAPRRAKFVRETRSMGLLLARWLVLAFLLESLILAYIPAESITAVLGGEGLMPILLASFIGVPAYLNGYAALPLVGGLMAQGMAPGAGMAFLVAGGITSVPAAMAVWAVVRPRVFGLYLLLALSGALLSGVSMQLWMGL